MAYSLIGVEGSFVNQNTHYFSITGYIFIRIFRENCRVDILVKLYIVNHHDIY